MKEITVGFTPLEKNEFSGALNYVELQDDFREGESISAEEIVTYLKKYRGLAKSTVYIWGATTYAGKAGGNCEMHNIHMNQGSRESVLETENAPWQDGAIVFDMGYGEQSIGMYIYFSTQTFEVDSNGQPLDKLK